MLSKFLRRLTTSFGLFCLIALGSATATRADQFFTFTGTPPGGSGPISATANIAQSGSTLVITLTNNTANIQDVSQAITDFKFSINGVSLTQTTGFTGFGRGINVLAGGTFTEVGNNLPDTITGGNFWSLTNTGPGSFYLNALGSGNPQFAILGPPNGSNVYSAANGSIAGNPAHNPFVLQTATFTFTVTGLAPNATFTNVVMSFGTVAGNDLPCTDCTTVPEPASMFLLGTGLLGAAAGIRRRLNSK